MKPVRSHDPARWRDRDVDAHALEARAAVLTDAARPAQPLGAQAVARIRAEVLEQAAGRRAASSIFDGFPSSRGWRSAWRWSWCAPRRPTAPASCGAGTWRRYGRPRARRRRPSQAPPRAPRRLHRAAASNDEALPDPAPETVAAPALPARFGRGPGGPASPRQRATRGAPARASAAPAPSRRSRRRLAPRCRTRTTDEGHRGGHGRRGALAASPARGSARRAVTLDAYAQGVPPRRPRGRGLCARGWKRSSGSTIGRRRWPCWTPCRGCRMSRGRICC